jgi:hypothetical protein
LRFERSHLSDLADRRGRDLTFDAVPRGQVRRWRRPRAVRDDAWATLTGHASTPPSVARLALATPSASPAAQRTIDRAAVQRAARDLLEALGADVDSESLHDTPRRVADAYAELLTPQPFRATTFPNDDGYDGLIVARAIPFHSLCMHHLLPFHGVAHIGYLPAERIVGLSSSVASSSCSRATCRSKRGLRRRSPAGCRPSSSPRAWA